MGIPNLALMALLWLSVAAIAAADYYTGPEIGLSLFYLIPIVIAGRRSSKAAAVALALGAAAGWQAADVSVHGVTVVSVWNGLTRLGIFVSAALLMVRQREDERRLANLNRQLQDVFEQEHRLARTDALTSLPNARMFRDEVQRALARARRDGEPITIAYMDLDNFKGINDRYGHAEGDEVLKDIASGIAAVVREGDLAARLGGDEFALLLHGCGQDALEAVGARLLAQVERVRTRYQDVEFGATIGFARFDVPAPDADSAIRAADRAMYAAKLKGKNRIEIAAAV